MENLRRHIENVGQFGVPVIVAINRFSADTNSERHAIIEGCRELGVDAIECDHWASGSAGTEALAQKVVEVADSGESKFKVLYDDNKSLLEKINIVAKKIYRATDVSIDNKVRKQLDDLESQGFGWLPICVAKTQYSFSTDPDLKGAPSNHTVPVREVRLSSGAEFLVVICGEIMTMPGLPRVPAANSINVDENNNITGLF